MAIKLTSEEYEELRSHPNRFAVFAEHTIPEAEHVIAGHRGWLLVEPLVALDDGVGARARVRLAPRRLA